MRLEIASANRRKQAWMLSVAVETVDVSAVARVPSRDWAAPTQPLIRSAAHVQRARRQHHVAGFVS